MTDFANILSQGGSRPSLLDTIYINLNLTFVTDELSGNVAWVFGLKTKPKAPFIVEDAIEYLYRWLLFTYRKSPTLYFNHLCTVLSKKTGRHNYMIIHGVPFAGKSTFFGLLSKVISVHRLTILDESQLDQQLAYAANKDAVLLNDLTIGSLKTLLVNRNILDGQPLNYNH